MKPNSKRRLALAFVASLLGAAAPALAEECPTKPDDAVCRPWSAILLPTAYGAVYAPNHGTAYAGGGLEAVLLAWSDNSPAFGPSQGRIRFDIGALRGLDMDTTLVMYRTGAQVSLERNASRGFAIPYFAVDFGGMWSDPTGRRWFVDGGFGMYIVHRRTLILDLEATGVLPFKNADDLAGITGRLALSFALW